MPNETPTGRAAVLALVKREGPVSADALAARLQLTPMAIRQHLQGLEGEGLVERTEAERLGGRGRPVGLWRTTPAAAARFADAHADLSAELIGQVRRVFGEDGLDRLLALRTADQAARYRPEVGAGQTLRARLEALAAIREREGYMAEVRDDPESGGFLLLEHHCPICAAARLCTGLCREELALFAGLLGEGVRIERLSHILAGAGRCAYRVTAVG
ncbi:MAG TPA: MarR family transcriptional regulator [Caulobacteraceae bacterium]|nr:MarR family transcriptional regulator [Caulobacteraceae bacterium]